MTKKIAYSWAWPKTMGQCKIYSKNMPTLKFAIIYSKQLHGIQDDIQIVFPEIGKKSYSRGKVV